MFGDFQDSIYCPNGNTMKPNKYQGGYVPNRGLPSWRFVFTTLFTSGFVDWLCCIYIYIYLFIHTISYIYIYVSMHTLYWSWFCIPFSNLYSELIVDKAVHCATYELHRVFSLSSINSLEIQRFTAVTSTSFLPFRSRLSNPVAPMVWEQWHHFEFIIFYNA